MTAAEQRELLVKRELKQLEEEVADNYTDLRRRIDEKFTGDNLLHCASRSGPSAANDSAGQRSCTHSACCSGFS